MTDETDQQRVRRLARESADACRSIIADIPSALPREKMNFHQKFHHDIPGKCMVVSMLTKEGREQILWEKVRAQANRGKHDLQQTFTAYASEKYGWDVVGANTLIAGIKSDELEIDEGRKELERDNPELLPAFDEERARIDAEERGHFANFPQDLQAMVKIKKNLDEIVQIARKNLGQEPHEEYGKPVDLGNGWTL